MTTGTGIETIQNVRDTKHESNGVDVPRKCGVPHVEPQITGMLREVAAGEFEALMDVFEYDVGGDGPYEVTARDSVGT